MKRYPVLGGEERSSVKKKERFRPNLHTWHIAILLLLMAFILRFPLVFFPDVIHNDGTEYIRHAKEAFAGNWTGGKSTPVYPVLIAFAYPFVRNYEVAGILVSVIFGTLLILPVFYLGKIIFNERVGIVSGLIAAVHPFLHKYSGYVLTESTYIFFVTASVLFGWCAFKHGRFRHILLLGLFVSLAYLTRPEGIGLLFVFVVWVLFINPPHVKRNWANRGGIIFLSIFCFLLFSSPYLIQLHKELGRWDISKKSSISIASTPGEDASPWADGSRDKINLLALVQDPLTLLRKMSVGLLESFYKFQQGFNPVLFFLAILGWIRIFRLKSSDAFKANFYVLSNHLFFFALVLPIFWVLRRYASHMVSISIPWAAFGCLEVPVWINRWFKKESLRKNLSFILLLLLLGGLFAQGRVTHQRKNRLIRREAGLWMKDHLSRNSKVMSRLPQEAFYAELPWMDIREGSYEEILRVARSGGVKYLVIDEDIEKGSPGFLRKIRGKDLILLKEFTKRSQKLAIYQIVYSE